MQATINVALAGIGGYGKNYVTELLEAGDAHAVNLIGVIDPYADSSPHVDELKQRQIPIYDDLDAFFAAHSVDLMLLSTPIHLHAPQTITSLAHGANVLCEKPLCATVQDAHAMSAAEAQNPGFVAIGYQWSFAQAIQNLKQDIMSGVMGKPLRLKSCIFWPRPRAYYQRNGWAARIRLDDSTWVLDSPANNATAHYLHNMLYVLGDTRETSARPARVQAELYRANAIENYDTAAMRCVTDSDVEILFYTTHVTLNNINPIFDFEFENATVTYVADSDRGIEARFTDGRRKDYGDPFAENMGKIWQCVDSVRTGERPACGIEAAAMQTLCVNGAQESPDAIIDFPAEVVRTVGDGDLQLTYVDGMEDILTTCYDTNCLPSEVDGIQWARAGRWIDLHDYHQFPNTTMA
jgi:predicted dehydrogenase